MKKFVETSSKENNDKINEWFYECQRKNVPYITVKTRTKFSDVHWDYISYPTFVDSILENNAEHIMQTAIEIFKRHANNKSKYRVSSGLVYFNDLEIASAKKAAEELYDFVNDLMQQKSA